MRYETDTTAQSSNTSSRLATISLCQLQAGLCQMQLWIQSSTSIVPKSTHANSVPCIGSPAYKFATRFTLACFSSNSVNSTCTTPQLYISINTISMATSSPVPFWKPLTAWFWTLAILKEEANEEWDVTKCIIGCHGASQPLSWAHPPCFPTSDRCSNFSLADCWFFSAYHKQNLTTNWHNDLAVISTHCCKVFSFGPSFLQSFVGILKIHQATHSPVQEILQTGKVVHNLLIHNKQGDNKPWQLLYHWYSIEANHRLSNPHQMKHDLQFSIVHWLD